MLLAVCMHTEPASDVEEGLLLQICWLAFLMSFILIYFEG